MRKVTVYSLQFTVLLTSYLLLVTPVFAADQEQDPCKSEVNTASTTAKGVDIGSKFGFGDITSLGCGTSRLVKPLFQVAAFLVILYFLLGAFRFLKAGGNKEDMDSARQMITHAIVGFIILMFAFLILQFLLARLLNISDLKIIG
ncbi:hypothetical protein HYZ05_01025 [Candidatus Daviesbacteria bacterium]|nr:hypothetical protein [Candidatus Daviesbacteria bacterium]